MGKRSGPAPVKVSPADWPRTRKPHIADRWKPGDDVRHAYEQGPAEAWDQVEGVSGPATAPRMTNRDSYVVGEVNVEAGVVSAGRPKRCGWCRRDRTGYRMYVYDVLGVDEVCCGWPCAYQWRVFRIHRRIEMDALIALGYLPRRIPGWYMPAATVDSLLGHHYRLRQQTEQTEQTEPEPTDLRKPAQPAKPAKPASITA